MQRIIRSTCAPEIVASLLFPPFPIEAVTRPRSRAQWSTHDAAILVRHGRGSRDVRICESSSRGSLGTPAASDGQISAHFQAFSSTYWPGAGWIALCLRLPTDLGAGIRFAGLVLREPFAPFRPPTPRYVLRGLEPAVRIGAGRAADPMIAFVLGRGIDNPRNVPAGTEDEGRVVGKQLGRGVGRSPRNDVVLARCV